jgi:hypothetical protein
MTVLQDPKPSTLASRLAKAITAYTRAFEDEAHRRNSFEPIRLPVPRDEVEASALELFLDEIRSHAPNVPIEIIGGS